MAHPIQKPERCCPQCAASFVSVIAREPSPEPGDFTACYCRGCVVVFAENLAPRYPNEEETALLIQAPAALAQIAMMQHSAVVRRHARN